VQHLTRTIAESRVSEHNFRFGYQTPVLESSEPNFPNGKQKFKFSKAGCGEAIKLAVAVSRLGLTQGTPLGAGRRLRSWGGRTADEIAAKNKQSRYHENRVLTASGHEGIPRSDCVYNGKLAPGFLGTSRRREVVPPCARAPGHKSKLVAPK